MSSDPKKSNSEELLSTFDGKKSIDAGIFFWVAFAVFMGFLVWLGT